jgi:nucleotide-binding universal stress UspA family protein
MKILLPVDGSDTSKRMLSYLAAHDELLGSDPDLLFVAVISPIPGYVAGFLDRATVDAYYDEQAENLLQGARRFALQHHWKFEVAHRHGPLADEIVDCATEAKAELIVMGTHGHTALSNVVLGSVSSGVLARCKIPVMLVRG